MKFFAGDSTAFAADGIAEIEAKSSADEPEFGGGGFGGFRFFCHGANVTVKMTIDKLREKGKSAVTFKD